MRIQLLTISLAILLAACGGSKNTQPPENPEQKNSTGQNITPPTTEPEISIHDAARKGNLAVIQQYIDNGSDLDRAEPVFGSALNNAVIYNQMEIVDALIKGGADVNIRQKSDGNTPVHSAAFFAYPEILKLLLEAGAEKAPKNLKGEIPIGISMVPWEDAQGIYLVVQGLLNSMIGEPKIPMDMDRIKSSLPEIFELLSDGQQLADIQNPRGENPAPGIFFEAAFNNDVEAIKKAIADGKDIDQRNKDGSTALLTAATLGSAEAAIALINGGADIDMKNQRGDTPLMAASFFCREKIVQALLDKGADKDIANIDGNRPIDAVATPWSQELEDLYRFMEQAITGIELDLENIRKTRPKIAEMLR